MLKKNPKPPKEPYVPHFLAVISTFAAFAGLNSKCGNITFLHSNGFNVYLDNSLFSNLASPCGLFFCVFPADQAPKTKEKIVKIMSIKSEISHR